MKHKLVLDIKKTEDTLKAMLIALVSGVVVMVTMVNIILVVAVFGLKIDCPSALEAFTILTVVGWYLKFRLHLRFKRETGRSYTEFVKG